MKTKKGNQSKLRGVLELLLVIGLILIIPLFFAIKSMANAPIPQGTGTPYARATATSVPHSNPSTSSSSPNNAKEPQACTFPLANITTTPSAPQNYTFSEPKVVLTAPQGNLYTIAEWLPDNQQVLITEDLNNANTPDNQINPENIDLFNPVTGNVKVYGTRPSTHELPSWDPVLNAVIYPVMNYYNIDTTNNTYKFNRQLWVSYGNPDTAQMLTNNLSQLPLAVKPGGDEIIYLTDKQISKLDKSLKNISIAQFDSTQWDYAKGRRDKNPLSFKMAWQPNTSLIFLYSDGAMGGGGYTFILNADSGQVCELNLGGWAAEAHWSSDGHYLAIERVTSPLQPADLTVLDIETGNLVTPVIASQEAKQHYAFYDFAWAPDNRHLLAFGSATPTGSGLSLYLVDLITGQGINVAPNYNFYTNSPDSISWSVDGSKAVYRCPTGQVDQICFISVQNGK